MIWLKLIIIFSITFGIITLAKYIIRKTFHIKKRKKPILLRHYVNDSHKKIDKILNRLNVIILLISLYLIMYREFSFNFFLYMVILTHSIEYAVQAYFERKCGDDPKQAILTISEISIVVIAILTIIQFDLLFA